MFVSQAQSGTGKTATFTIGILQSIDEKVPKVQALILAPARELAQQVHIWDYMFFETIFLNYLFDVCDVTKVTQPSPNIYISSSRLQMINDFHRTRELAI